MQINISTDKLFLEFFNTVEDPRNGKNKRYLISEILLLTLCAILSGADSWRDIVKYGKLKIEYLRNFLPYKHGTPSKNTLYRFFALLNAKMFADIFLIWIGSMNIEKKLIAIDGKTLCNSHNNDAKAIHMLSAYAVNESIVIGQEKIADNSNEIIAIPVLLEKMDIKDSIITIDAMGTQKKIAQTIINKSGDYILALKDNHSILHNDVIDFFNDHSNLKYCDIDENVDCGHSRIETRKCVASNEIEWLGKLKFPGQKSIFCIHSQREIGNAIETEKRYYISSLPTNAKQFNECTRKHWGIENSLHWVLDVVFKEDYSRVRLKNSAHNMAIVRHIALNLLKIEQKKHTKDMSIGRLRKSSGWSDDVLSSILSG